MAFAVNCQTTEVSAQLEDAVRSNPNSAEAWYKLGIGKFRRTWVDDAKIAFEKAIELRPDYAEAHYALGAWYLSKRRCLLGGDFIKKRDESHSNAITAVDILKRAIELKPVYPEALEQLGQAYYSRLGKPAEATEAFEKAIAQGTKKLWVFVYLAQIYEKFDRYDNAISLYKSVTAKFVSSQQSRINRAVLDLFDQFWTDRAYENLARLYATIGRHLEARETYEEIIRLGIENADTHYELGLLYVKSGDRYLAQQEYDALKRIESETSDNYFRKGIKKNARDLLSQIKR